jgi:hypothetical protein
LYSLGQTIKLFGQDYVILVDETGTFFKRSDGYILRAQEIASDADKTLLRIEEKGQEVLAVVRRGVGMTQAELEALYDTFKDDPLGDYLPGTPEHKAERWAQYKESGGDWSYDRWSNTYESNMSKATAAHAKVGQYYNDIGFPCPSGATCKEVTLKVNVGGTSVTRRLDIANKDGIPPHGIEVKAYETGKVYASKDILTEVAADAELVKLGWKIEWKFIDCDLSDPLRQALKDAGITIL